MGKKKKKRRNVKPLESNQDTSLANGRANFVFHVLAAVPGVPDLKLKRKPCIELLESIIEKRGTRIPTLDELKKELEGQNSSHAASLLESVEQLRRALAEKGITKEKDLISGGWIRVRHPMALVYEEAASLDK